MSLSSQHVVRFALSATYTPALGLTRERENVSTPSLDRTDTSNVDATSPSVRPRRKALLWGMLVGLLVLAAVGIVAWRAASLQHRPVRRGRNLGTQPVGITTIK